MDIQAEKIRLMELLLHTNKEGLIKKVKALFDKEEKSSIDAYNKELEEADKRIREGKYINQKDLEKAAKKW